LPGDVQEQGAGQFVGTLPAAIAALQDLSGPADQAGQLLAADGAANAPYKTGRLSRSHGYTVTGTGLTVTAATPYAAQVEAEEPWLADTLTDDTSDVVDIYTTGVTDALALIQGA
jgi:hypothetical protein